MIRRPYPDGLDCVWLASDRDGYLGGFITAGIGPIPAVMLEHSCIPIEDVECRIFDLPIVSRAKILVSVKRPDDFIGLAERGLHVYDWTDINRAAREMIGVYESVAVPTHPINIKSLTSDLSILAEMLRLSNMKFSSRNIVDVRANFNCAEIY